MHIKSSTHPSSVAQDEDLLRSKFISEMFEIGGKSGIND